MVVLRTLVWSLNLGGAVLLWSAAVSEPTSGHQQVLLAFVATVMSVTLVYVWMLEAAQRTGRRKG